VPIRSVSESGRGRDTVLRSQGCIYSLKGGLIALVWYIRSANTISPLIFPSTRGNVHIRLQMNPITLGPERFHRIRNH
jgi:hypothetical protein